MKKRKYKKPKKLKNQNIHNKPKKKKKSRKNNNQNHEIYKSLWNTILGIVLTGLGIAIFIFILFYVGDYIGSKKDIIKFTKNSQVVEGVVQSVDSQWVNNPGKHEIDYTLHSVVVAYTNEQGEEVLFESDNYKKNWDEKQNIKLIANSTSMDIAYFDILTLRYAPMHLKENGFSFLFVLVGSIWICYRLSSMGLVLLTAPKRPDELVEKEDKEKKIDYREKEFKLSQSKILTGFLTVVLCGIFSFMFIYNFGILNPFSTYWNKAVVRESRFTYLEDNNGKLDEIYKYDCHFTTRQGENMVGYVTAEKGKWISGDVIVFLCYEGIEGNSKLYTPFNIAGYFILPLLSLLAYIVMKIQHAKALEEKKHKEQ